jgi:hypothetical protein
MLFALDVSQRSLQKLETRVLPVSAENLVENGTCELELESPCSIVSGAETGVASGRPSNWFDAKATVSMRTVSETKTSKKKVAPRRSGSWVDTNATVSICTLSLSLNANASMLQRQRRVFLVTVEVLDARV